MNDRYNLWSVFLSGKSNSLRFIMTGLCFVLILAAGIVPAQAQDFTVSGTVISAGEQEPLPGVNILEVGTQRGTTTDGNGEFTLAVSSSNATLRFTFVGFATTTVDVNGQSELTVELDPQTQALDDVVVTALGLERQSKSLGYSVSDVGADELVLATETNTANLLQGKVAGVNVNPTSGGPGSSSRVTIRGSSSLAGNNQPLYVVDGVPIDNTNIGSAGMWGGFDGGDGISQINSEDIENISVLKGASAAALYGTRARDGVVQITTKSGRAGQSPTVNFSSTITMEDALVSFTDYQDEYGQGNLGQAPQSQQEALATGLNAWGALLDGSSVVQFDGQERPYVDQGNQLENFYRTGISSKNMLSLSGGSESSTYYFSTTRKDAESVVPNSGLDRTSLTLRGSHTFGNLTADVKANYINENAQNRTRVSDSPGNPNFAVAVLPPNLNVNTIKENHIAPDGSEGVYQNANPFVTNPYWAVNQFSTDDSKDRILGHVNLDYQLADWANLSARTGRDQYTLRRTEISAPWGTAYNPSGAMSENEYRVMESTTDILLNLDRQFTSSFVVNATLGGSRSYSKNETVGITGSAFKVPKFRTISNMANSSPNYNFSERQINSLFGSADLAYEDLLFLTVTARNDWSSTLPEDENAFFYPSVSSSFVFSEAFSLPTWLSFGKVRASWAEVGNDTDPYQLNLTYNILNFTHQGQSLSAVAQDAIPLADLKPTSTVEVELGFDLRFFDDRLTADFTWYDRQTTNQILSTTVSNTTGYGSRVINAGRLDNSGIELLLTGIPFSTNDMFWETSVNYGRNSSEVVELAGEQETLLLDQSRTQNAFITATVGEEYGTIEGFKYERDGSGNIIHENGLPVRSERTILGKGTPDWTAGWSNTLSYKTVSLNVLIDAQWGGQIFSGTNAYAYQFGFHKNTLEGRAECDQGSVPYPTSGCFVAEGADVDGGANSTAVTPSSYYSDIGSNITEEFVYDANFIKLRQLQLNYQLPQSLMANIPLRSASVSVVGRNLFYLYDPVPNIDPEAAINRGNGQGLELAGVPGARSFGLSIDLGF